jgi:hypothetical protein
MPDNEKKPLLHTVPGVLTGVAALIASLTAVYVNVRHDSAPEPAHIETPVTTAPPAPPAPAAEAGPQKLRLQLDRIAVQHDGAMGTADWRFSIEADDQPLFVFGQEDLDDSGGRNVVLPKDAVAQLRLAPGKSAHIVVKAWRNRRLHFGEGAPDATGEGVLATAGAMAPLAVSAAKPDKGAFVLYFSATAE